MLKLNFDTRRNESLTISPQKAYSVNYSLRVLNNMGAIMALLPSEFKKTAKSLGAALLTTVFMAANVNAAPNTPIELTCHTTPEAITAVKTQILQAEGMIPVTSHFKNVGTDQKPAWAMATLMMNPKNGKGYEWAKMPQGHVCVSKRYSDVQLFSNVSFNPKAFLDKSVYPNANLGGNGKDISTSGINASLITNKEQQRNPMYRANVDNIINIEKKPLNTPTRYVEILVANPITKEGTILAANLQGNVIAEYYNVVGSPSKDGVKFGSVYTPAGEDLIGPIAAGNASPTIAMAKLEKN